MTLERYLKYGAQKFFCPAGDGEPGKLYRNPGKNIGSKTSAIRTPGADLAGIDNFPVNFTGDTLDHGGIQEGVEARVAGLLPFLVLKAYAIEQRDKEKVSYEIWTLNAFEQGPKSAVDAMANSAAIGRPEVSVAVGYLRQKLSEHRTPRAIAIREVRAFR